MTKEHVTPGPGGGWGDPDFVPPAETYMSPFGEQILSDKFYGEASELLVLRKGDSEWTRLTEIKPLLPDAVPSVEVDDPENGPDANPLPDNWMPPNWPYPKT